MSALRGRLLGSAGAVALMLGATGAVAGGFAIREQSTSSQGASFAGNAAGGDLSSSYWNSAAITVTGSGLATESHYSVIFPDVEVTSASVTRNPGFGTSIIATGGKTFIPNVGDTQQMGKTAFVGSSYGAYRLNDQLVLGIAINSPFGQATEPKNPSWSGMYHQRTGKLFTLNANPMVGFQLSPQLSIGAGAQIQYMSLSFKRQPGTLGPGLQDSSVLDGEDMGFGWTAGVLWRPTPATSIGLGFRSAVNHTVDGASFVVGNNLYSSSPVAKIVPTTPVSFEAQLATPEIVTLSLRQSLSPTTRLLGTAEWTNWSRLDKVDFVARSTGGLTTLGALGIPSTKPGDLLSTLDFHWTDGWFFSAGYEWDYSSSLTLRTGIAYEQSPIQNADQRKVGITDSNRIWTSIGATYKWSQSTSFDFAYSHIFFDSAPIDTLTTAPGSAIVDVLRFQGKAEQSGDIVSFSMKTKW